MSLQSLLQALEAVAETNLLNGIPTQTASQRNSPLKKLKHTRISML